MEAKTYHYIEAFPPKQISLVIENRGIQERSYKDISNLLFSKNKLGEEEVVLTAFSSKSSVESISDFLEINQTPSKQIGARLIAEYNDYKIVMPSLTIEGAYHLGRIPACHIVLIGSEKVLLIGEIKKYSRFAEIALEE